MPNIVHIGSEEYPTWMNSLVDGHTWLNNVREYIKMLNGEVELPHAIVSYPNGRIPSSINCKLCVEAYKRREQYRKQLTILSKET